MGVCSHSELQMGLSSNLSWETNLPPNSLATSALCGTFNLLCCDYLQQRVLLFMPRANPRVIIQKTYERNLAKIFHFPTANPARQGKGRRRRLSKAKVHAKFKVYKGNRKEEGGDPRANGTRCVCTAVATARLTHNFSPEAFNSI